MQFELGNFEKIKNWQKYKNRPGNEINAFLICWDFEHGGKIKKLQT